MMHGTKRKAGIFSTSHWDGYNCDNCGIPNEVNGVAINAGNRNQQYSNDEWGQLPSFIWHLLYFAKDYAVDHGNPFTGPAAVYTKKTKKIQFGGG